MTAATRNVENPKTLTQLAHGSKLSRVVELAMVGSRPHDLALLATRSVDGAIDDIEKNTRKRAPEKPFYGLVAADGRASKLSIHDAQAFIKEVIGELLDTRYFAARSPESKQLLVALSLWFINDSQVGKRLQEDMTMAIKETKAIEPILAHLYHIVQNDGNVAASFGDYAGKIVDNGKRITAVMGIVPKSVQNVTLANEVLHVAAAKNLQQTIAGHALVGVESYQVAEVAAIEFLQAQRDAEPERHRGNWLQAVARFNPELAVQMLWMARHDLVGNRILKTKQYHAHRLGFLGQEDDQLNLTAAYARTGKFIEERAVISLFALPSDYELKASIFQGLAPTPSANLETEDETPEENAEKRFKKLVVSFFKNQDKFLDFDSPTRIARPSLCMNAADLTGVLSYAKILSGTQRGTAMYDQAIAKVPHLEKKFQELSQMFLLDNLRQSLTVLEAPEPENEPQGAVKLKREEARAFAVTQLAMVGLALREGIISEPAKYQAVYEELTEHLVTHFFADVQTKERNADVMEFIRDACIPYWPEDQQTAYIDALYDEAHEDLTLLENGNWYDAVHGVAYNKTDLSVVLPGAKDEKDRIRPTMSAYVITKTRALLQRQADKWGPIVAVMPTLTAECTAMVNQLRQIGQVENELRRRPLDTIVPSPTLHFPTQALLLAAELGDIKFGEEGKGSIMGLLTERVEKEIVSTILQDPNTPLPLAQTLGSIQAFAETFHTSYQEGMDKLEKLLAAMAASVTTPVIVIGEDGRVELKRLPPVIDSSVVLRETQYQELAKAVTAFGTAADTRVTAAADKFPDQEQALALVYFLKSVEQGMGQERAQRFIAPLLQALSAMTGAKTEDGEKEKTAEGDATDSKSNINLWLHSGGVNKLLALYFMTRDMDAAKLGQADFLANAIESLVTADAQSGANMQEMVTDLGVTQTYATVQSAQTAIAQMNMSTLVHSGDSREMASGLETNMSALKAAQLLRLQNAESDAEEIILTMDEGLRDNYRAAVTAQLIQARRQIEADFSFALVQGGALIAQKSKQRAQMANLLLTIADEQGRVTAEHLKWLVNAFKSDGEMVRGIKEYVRTMRLFLGKDSYIVALPTQAALSSAAGFGEVKEIAVK